MGLSCSCIVKRNIIRENKVSVVLKKSLVFVIVLFVG